jgi:ribosomal protein S3
MNDIYSKIATKIIEQQESIIGPVAIEQAKQVKALDVDWTKHLVSIVGDERSAIDKLVAQYKELFGQISVEVCKEAASKLLAELPAQELPKSLQ